KPASLYWPPRPFILTLKLREHGVLDRQEDSIALLCRLNPERCRKSLLNNAIDLPLAKRLYTGRGVFRLPIGSAPLGEGRVINASSSHQRVCGKADRIHAIVGSGGDSKCRLPFPELLKRANTDI